MPLTKFFSLTFMLNTFGRTARLMLTYKKTLKIKRGFGKSNPLFMVGVRRLLLDFLHARIVSQMNLWFNFAQYSRYPD